MSSVDCAVILAGGKGTRLLPLTSNTPKPLIPVALTPMIDFAIQQVLDAGIKKIIVAVKYLGDQIRDYLETSAKYKNIEFIIPDINPIGTADAVRLVSDIIDGDFVVTMADIVSNLSLTKMINFFKKTNAYATISLKNIDFPTKKFGVIMLDEHQNIDVFLEKPLPQDLLFTTLAFAYRPATEFHQNLVNTGIYVFQHKVLEILEKFSDIIDFGKDVFPYLLQERFKLNGYVADYYWLDCGNIKSYLWANYDILRGFVEGFAPPGINNNGIWIGKNAQISDKAILKQPVIIGNNIVVEEDVSIGPFSVIGNNVTIREKCVIDQSVIWDNSEIGKESQIIESVVCNNMLLDDRKIVKNFSAIAKVEKEELVEFK